MIMALLRRDPALGPTALMMRFGLPLAVVIQIWVPSGWSSQPNVGQVTVIAIAVFSTLMAWIVTLGPASQGRIRVFEYQLALPISARKIVALRLVAHLLPGFVLFAILPISQLANATTMSIGLRAGLQFVAFCTAWAFFVLSLFVWKPNLPRVDSSKVYRLLAVLGAVVLTLPFFVPRLALLITVPGSAWMVIHLWRRVPETMSQDSVVAVAQASAPVGDLDREESRKPTHPMRVLSLNSWIARQILLRPQFLVTAASVFYFAMLTQWTLSGMLFQVPMTVFFTGILLNLSSVTLSDFVHLPVSRRLLAAWILLPSVVLLLAGTLVGQALAGDWSTWGFRREVQLSFETGEESEKTFRNWNLQVPGELLQFHWGDGPIKVEAPGGEATTIEPKLLFWGLPLRLVNPYDVSPENSADFIAWQLSRAVRDAYGLSVSPEKLRGKAMKGKTFSTYHFQQSYPGANARSYPRGRLAVGLGFSAFLWCSALLLFTLERLPPRRRLQWRGRVAARITFGVLVVVAFCAVYRFDTTHGLIYAKLRRAAEGWMETSMISHPWSAAAVGIAGIVAIVLWGVRRIDRVEMPLINSAADAAKSSGHLTL